MALAFRAPYDSYDRRHAITQHAIERLRERLTEDGRTEHRDDRDLGNYLDACIHAALQAGREEPFEDKNSTAWLVDIEPEVSFPLVAILKTDRYDPSRRACVTILSADMVARYKAQGTLGVGRPEPTAKLGQVFGDQLRQVTVATPRPVATAVATRLASWTRDGRTEYAEYAADEVQRRIEELVAGGVDPKTVRVWKPVTTRVRVVVDIDEQEEGRMSAHNNERARC